MENRIDEFKRGVTLDKASQSSFKSNQYLAIMKKIAYNLLQGFKRLLPIKVLPNEVPTLQRVFIKQPGNIYGKGEIELLKCLIIYSLKRPYLY